ncbi:prestin [Brachionus plicatilis]|uniref:Prestin n=1 Tax=Brachionus plicatilis TaxID=10195 RepID=A0A3M7T1P5_BRAPC|nr:prestin [Brachionus plicatilis]
MDENENWANRRVVSVNRPAFSQKEFDSKFSTKAESNGEKGSKIRTILAKLSPINLLGTFTILSFITEYNFKKYLITDMLSGITVGVMHIPSSLAYGALTSLNPVHGLYTSFFTGITYIFFGTSKHLSVGTFAVTSLIVYSTISRLETEYPELAFPNSFENSTSTEGPSMEFKIKVATGLAFWCGVIQIIFSLLKFGSISKFLSQPLLRGFTTAAAFHVFSSQMKHIFGIYYVNRKRRKG